MAYVSVDVCITAAVHDRQQPSGLTRLSISPVCVSPNSNSSFLLLKTLPASRPTCFRTTRLSVYCKGLQSVTWGLKSRRLTLAGSVEKWKRELPSLAPGFPAGFLRA